MELALVVFMASLGSIGTAAVSGALLVAGDRTLRFVPAIVSLATGTLLASATLDLLPKALELESASKVMGLLLAGLLGFFLLERLLVWRHAHGSDVPVRGPAGQLILTGDALHNFVDGVAVGAAFVVSPALGVGAALAVVAHELPQEVGDFGILLHSGWSRRSAYLLNVASALPTIPGAIIAYLSFSVVGDLLYVVLALAASSFLYVALADLVPHLNERGGGRLLASQLVLVLLGVALIWAVGALVPE